MNTLNAFGLFAVTAMLVTYALEERNRGFVLAFAGSCALGSLYGFFQGAWPFGIVEAIWALVAGASLVAERMGNHNRTPLKVIIPRVANTMAAVTRIAFTGSCPASLSPMITAGTFATTMPSVVPMTTK